MLVYQRLLETRPNEGRVEGSFFKMVERTSHGEEAASAMIALASRKLYACWLGHGGDEAG